MREEQESSKWIVSIKYLNAQEALDSISNDILVSYIYIYIYMYP